MNLKCQKSLQTDGLTNKRKTDGRRENWLGMKLNRTHGSGKHIMSQVVLKKNTMKL